MLLKNYFNQLLVEWSHFRRENLVEDMIGRNVENTVELNEKESFLVSKLHVKETIIYYAKGILIESQKK